MKSTRGVLTYIILFVCIAFLANGFDIPPQLPLIPPSDEKTSSSGKESLFTLHHIIQHPTHQTANLSTIQRHDISSPFSSSNLTLWIDFFPDSSKPGKETASPVVRPLTFKVQDMQIERLEERRTEVINRMVETAQSSSYAWGHDFWSSEIGPAWTVDTVQGPNVTDKETILTLAHMTANAYEPIPHHGAWRNVSNDDGNSKGAFNESLGFGWDKDGIRGYVYANPDASIIVVSLKGGSFPFTGSDSSTYQNDKENVILLFSCCCGQGSIFYHHVCDCSNGGKTCDIACLGECIRGKEKYYAAAREVYALIEGMYPDAQIWLTGHSLGGALSSLLAHTYGVPAITFETPPDALPVSRLGLPTSPTTTNNSPKSPQNNRSKNTGVYHFGITSDPIYTGTCRGPGSSCFYAGVPFESTCHTGKKCVYDVVGDLGWRSSIRTHGIAAVIRDVIEKYEVVPPCVEVGAGLGCEECVGWEEVRTTTTTVTGSSTEVGTSTGTSTCETPGWFHCRDQTKTKTSIMITTTTMGTRTRTSTGTGTSTCETPGWFHCRDHISLTSHIATSTTTITTRARVSPDVVVTSTPPPKVDKQALKTAI